MQSLLRLVFFVIATIRNIYWTRRIDAIYFAQNSIGVVLPGGLRFRVFEESTRTALIVSTGVLLMKRWMRGCQSCFAKNLLSDSQFSK